METFRNRRRHRGSQVAFLLGSGINGNLKSLGDKVPLAIRVAFLLGSGINGNFGRAAIRLAIAWQCRFLIRKWN